MKVRPKLIISALLLAGTVAAANPSHADTCDYEICGLGDVAVQETRRLVRSTGIAVCTPHVPIGPFYGLGEWCPFGKR